MNLLRNRNLLTATLLLFTVSCPLLASENTPDPGGYPPPANIQPPSTSTATKTSATTTDNAIATGNATGTGSGPASSESGYDPGHTWGN